jgi:hypothetical protein
MGFQRHFFPAKLILQKLQHCNIWFDYFSTYLYDIFKTGRAYAICPISPGTGSLYNMNHLLGFPINASHTKYILGRNSLWTNLGGTNYATV